MSKKQDSQATYKDDSARDNSVAIFTAPSLCCQGMDQRQKLQEGLIEIWKRHLPEITERVELLGQACEQIRSGRFSDDDREKAIFAAHKLAGVLGTFGREEGSAIARAIEHRLEQGQPPRGYAQELELDVVKLRRIVSSE